MILIIVQYPSTEGFQPSTGTIACIHQAINTETTGSTQNQVQGDVGAVSATCQHVKSALISGTCGSVGLQGQVESQRLLHRFSITIL